MCSKTETLMETLMTWFTELNTNKTHAHHGHLTDNQSKINDL